MATAPNSTGTATPDVLRDGEETEPFFIPPQTSRPGVTTGSPQHLVTVTPVWAKGVTVTGNADGRRLITYCGAGLGLGERLGVEFINHLMVSFPAMATLIICTAPMFVLPWRDLRWYHIEKGITADSSCPGGADMVSILNRKLIYSGSDAEDAARVCPL